MMTMTMAMTTTNWWTVSFCGDEDSEDNSDNIDDKDDDDEKGPLAAVSISGGGRI